MDTEKGEVFDAGRVFEDVPKVRVKESKSRVKHVPQKVMVEFSGVVPHRG